MPPRLKKKKNICITLMQMTNNFFFITLIPYVAH
jgi:hypothetical protein